MPNENETPKAVAHVAKPNDTSGNARSLLLGDDDDARAAEARLDAIYAEGQRPSRPHD